MTIRSFALAFCLIYATSASAHQSAANPPRTSIDVAAAYSWRSDGAVETTNSTWHIPGVMMGGEAYPVMEGHTLDELTLTLIHQINASWYGVVEAGTHDSTDDHESMELEHAYLGWKCCTFTNSSATVELGKMSANFSPSVSKHPSARLFSEAPLVLDAFLGRTFHDKGARITWQQQNGFTAGIESWHGNAFPASPPPDGGSLDIFASYQWQSDKLLLVAGGWLMQADAELRADSRYVGGHQHTTAFSETITDVRFSGTTDLAGLHAQLQWQLTQNVALDLQGEWIESDADGEITDGTRFADLTSDNSGFWAQSSLLWRKHIFSVRVEELSLQNDVTGTGADQLITDASLASADENPQRLAIGWHYQWSNNLAFRLEGIDDQSTADERSRIVLGVIWRERLWEKR